MNLAEYLRFAVGTTFSDFQLKVQKFEIVLLLIKCRLIAPDENKKSTIF